MPVSEIGQFIYNVGSTNIYFATLSVLIIFSIFLFFRWRIDPREPFHVPAKIPFVGHALGLLRHGASYYKNAVTGYSFPIYTLDLLVTKVYIVTSARLVPAVQRNSKVLSFDPFLTAAAKQLGGIKKAGLKLLEPEDKGGQGVNLKVLRAMHPALLGAGLDAMNKNMIGRLCSFVDELAGGGNHPVDLHLWCRDAITQASTDAVWGPLNPFKLPGISNAFWEYESNLNVFLLSIRPPFMAGSIHKARENVVKAFIDYYDAGGQNNSSELAFARWKAQNDAGAATEDIARLETAGCIGVLSNTVPTTFWALFELYSRPDLLSRLRDELRQNCLRIDLVTKTHTVDLGRIRDNCPKFVSAFQEILRLRSSASPLRVVCKDVLLDNQYLLKAGCFIQMPGSFINREEAFWGPTAQEFDPTRFEAGKLTQRPTSFTAFGTSPNVCPGRHFASGEILALSAMVILRYDITPVGGKWWSPKLNTKAIAASVVPPGEGYPVVISKREEFPDEATWKFDVTEGKSKFGLITG
ncbi:putative P450 monooxygenase [Xylona heveae TC161]|uniref:Putative P450 monooxygenase n=1 Tax=Xylona heveae (strain CBS 132557 / TC161) TaxID=1328760 RepID=A0A165HT21_XYLHT|nr:putative P450 monooxygenase [Xylona heveae TC161]KZF23898.1 putative P450 monooxygenase [Xylona heveae TC161]